MHVIYLGMPGTGKTAACHALGKCITFDFGKTADIGSRTFPYVRGVLRSIYRDFDNIGFDTRLEYFKELPRDAQIFIAIPEDLNFILERVQRRDGHRSAFYRLYVKNAEKWRTEWLNKTQQYRSWDNVTFVDHYDMYGEFKRNAKVPTKK